MGQEISIKDQAFGQTTKEASISFIFGKFDGILGLGYDTIAVNGVQLLFYSMNEQTITDKPVFSVWLRDVEMKYHRLRGHSLTVERKICHRFMLDSRSTI